MPPLLQIRNLQVDFKTETGISNAVRQVSLQVNRGEIVAIVGESGSGKSVTALSVLQLLPVSTVRYSIGEILFSTDGIHSKNLLSETASGMQRIRGKDIGMIFQEPMTSLNPVFTCGHQVTEAIRQHHKIDARAAKQMAIHLFEQVQLPNPSQLFHRYPHQLSGGQKQRVMIAMSMSGNPSLLICDEPTTALDVVVQKTILSLIKQLQQKTRMGVLFITHDLGVVAEIAHRALVMYKGTIVEEGTIHQIFEQPQHPYTQGLLACRPVLHRKGERLPVVSDFLEGGNRKYEVGSRRYEELPGDGRHEVLLRAENISVWFPAKKNFWGKPIQYTKAVDDVSFEVFRGETLGLVGESGCGKTTLGRTLLRLIEPYRGRMFYDGKDITAQRAGSLKKLRRKIQIIFQDPYSSLNPRLSIGNAIIEALSVHNIYTSKKERYKQVQALLEKVNLEPDLVHRYPHEFSGGQRQRIVIARALSLKPDFLVCDESVSALDVSVQAQVLNLLNDLKQEFGFTVVFISHDLSVIRYLCDRIIVMNKGRIVEIGDSERLYAQPQSQYTRQLIESLPGNK